MGVSQADKKSMKEISFAQAQQAGRATLSDGTMIVEGSLDGSVISSSPIVGAGDSNIAVPLGLTGSYFWLQRQEGEGPGFRNTHRTTLAGFVPIQLSDVNILFLDGRVARDIPENSPAGEVARQDFNGSYGYVMD